MNNKFHQHFRSRWASAGAVLCSVLGVIFFVILTAGSFESTETPAAVIGLSCAAAVLNCLCFFDKDYFHAVSVVGFLSSLGCMSAFTAGRVSYLAFYLSGDVMNTGLSPFFFLGAVAFVLSVIFAALAMAQPFEGEGWGEAVKHLIVAVASLVIIAIVAAAVVRVIMTPASISSNSAVAETEAAETVSLYKTPTKEASFWQAYTAQQSAQEDVSGKSIAYQFPCYVEVNNRKVNLLVNLYEDGFVRMYQYVGKDLHFEYNGYWRNRDDEALYFGVSNYSFQGESIPSRNLMTGDVATVDYSYDLVMENDSFSFGCNFCLAFADGGQFVRSGMVEGTGAVQFATLEEFVASIPSDEPAPTEATQEGPQYPANTFLLEFTPDISEKLKDTFSCESSVWGPALGQTGSYTPNDAEDVLFAWTGPVDSKLLTFYTNGTYVYEFTSMSIKENGTWTFEGWTLTTTTAGGNTATGEIVKAAPAAQEPEAPAYPANTFLLEFTPDISEKLKDTFSCESSIWGPALGQTGSYTPNDAEDVLFAWTGPVDSKLLTFYTNGTYAYEFTSMSIKENGAWTFEGWTLTTTTAAGNTAIGKIVK